MAQLFEGAISCARHLPATRDPSGGKLRASTSLGSGLRERDSQRRETASDQGSFVVRFRRDRVSARNDHADAEAPQAVAVSTGKSVACTERSRFPNLGVLHRRPSFPRVGNWMVKNQDPYSRSLEHAVGIGKQVCHSDLA